jgi:Ca-activated chloride channel family protein
MTEDELKALKDLPAPAPRAGAKSAALAASLAAFDAGEKNNPDTAKGTGEANRLTHASQAKRRQPMRVSTVTMRMAASFVALTVATVSTLYFVAPQFVSHTVYYKGDEAGRQTALVERRQDQFGGKAFPQADKKVYERLGQGDGEAGPVSVASPSEQMTQGVLEERIDRALRDQPAPPPAPVDSRTVTTQLSPAGRAASGGTEKAKSEAQPEPETAANAPTDRDDAKPLARMPAAKPAPYPSVAVTTAPGTQAQPGQALSAHDGRIVGGLSGRPSHNRLAKSELQREAGSSSANALLLQADELVDDKANDRIVVKGNVEVYYKNHALVADTLTYDQKTNTLNAVGNVRIKEPDGAVVAADRITLTDEFRDGFIRSFETVTKDKARVAVAGKDGSTTVFEKGVFSPCKDAAETCAGPIWRIHTRENRDKFEAPEPNPVKQVAAEPVSTFSIDVDTASYAFARRAISDGHLPPKDAVRVEEMVNYFPYDYPRPEAADAPFQPSVTVMPAPWKPANKLVHIGIKGYELVPTERPRANLVFLIDISGSMASADKLPLVKNAFRLMLDQLQPDDTVGLVTYASGSGIALEPTKVSEKRKILRALDALGAGGSTAGAQGLSDAYRLAEEHFDKTGVNRIILATDGDFNVGISNQDELKGFIERKRDAGIFLSILGVGEGNYNDALMQTLAQNGNGTAAYVDTLNEARKVLVDEASSTLFTIARDVKIQVEFNPSQVSEYRLIGYETRALKREDFNNDKVDAGDVGSGHTVTAIYEITPKGAPKLVDDLRYGAPGGGTQPAESVGQGGEYGFLKLRYKLPKEQASKLITLPITPALERSDIAAAPDDVRFSVAVAGFGQLLRGLPYLGNYNYDDVLALAQGARGADPYGYRAEFLNLVRLAKSARP